MEDLDIKRWCWPFYLDFLHGNFASSSNYYSVGRRTRSQWIELLQRERHSISPEIVGDLMMDSDWRTQICGAYFCGLNKWDQFTIDIGRRLVAKQNIFATQGYAFALARMPSHASANYLCGYLSRIGRPEDTTDCYGSDLEWVIAALQWVDAHMNTNRLEPYIGRLVPLWQKQRFQNLTWEYRALPTFLTRQELASSNPTDNSRVIAMKQRMSYLEKELDFYFLPDDGNRKSEWFWKLMEFCEEHFDATR